MKIIFFINGEPFNFFDQDARLHRVGHLIKKCQELDINYEVWTSDFYHQKKIFYNNKNINFKIIKSLGYKKNISLNRFLDNIIYSFKVYFELKRDKFDNCIFVSAFPIPEVCFAVSVFAKKNKIPLIIDLRDMWPLIFYNLSNNFLIKNIIKIIFFYQEILNKYTFRNSNGIFSITDNFLNYGLKYSNRKKKSSDKVFYLAHSVKETNKLNINNSLKNIFPKNKIVICFFGVISYKKFDFLNLIKVVNNLKDSPIFIIICGKGDDEDRLTSEIGSNFLYLNWINQSQMSYIASKSNFGLAHYKPTYDFNSSIPNKIIEYISYKLPIIHSLKGDTYDLLDSEKINNYYKYGDSRSLEKLIHNLDRHSKIKDELKFSKLFEKKFNANKVYESYINQVIKIYHESH